MSAAKKKKPAKKKAARTKAAPGAVQLEVCLHKNGDPAVWISVRNKKVPTGTKIKWRKSPGAPSFTFEDFQPQGTNFNNVVIKPNGIDCDFSSSEPPNSPHEYTLAVKAGGTTYTSDESSMAQPTGGRAVIRN